MGLSVEDARRLRSDFVRVLLLMTSICVAFTALVDKLQLSLDSINSSLQLVNSKLELSNSRLGELITTLEGVYEKVDSLDHDLGDIKKMVSDMDNELEDLDSKTRTIKDMTIAIDASVDVMEANLALVTTHTSGILIQTTAAKDLLINYLIPISSWEPYIISTSAAVETIAEQLTVMDANLAIVSTGFPELLEAVLLQSVTAEAALVVSEAQLETMAAVAASAAASAATAVLIEAGVAYMVTDYSNPIIKLGHFNVHVKNTIDTRPKGTIPVRVSNTIEAEIVSMPPVGIDGNITISQPIDVVIINETLSVDVVSVLPYVQQVNGSVNISGSIESITDPVSISVSNDLPVYFKQPQNVSIGSPVQVYNAAEYPPFQVQIPNQLSVVVVNDVSVTNGESQFRVIIDNPDPLYVWVSGGELDLEFTDSMPVYVTNKVEVEIDKTEPILASIVGDVTVINSFDISKQFQVIVSNPDPVYVWVAGGTLKPHLPPVIQVNVSNEPYVRAHTFTFPVMVQNEVAVINSHHPARKLKTELTNSAIPTMILGGSSQVWGTSEQPLWVKYIP